MMMMMMMMMMISELISYRNSEGGAGIAQSVWLWDMGWMTGVLVPVGATDFSPLHSAQTSSEAQPASYPMGAGGSFTEDKAVGERS
jgi:hypothetical protein